tara:strand:- start:435 stop:1058 length:624 start_codon:yes stop_codon:yes gene_type:complete
MKDMFRIVVSQNIQKNSERQQINDSLDHRLVNWILALGAIPIPVPNSLESNLELWLKCIEPQAIILSGGNDLGNYPERDASEMKLIEYARILRIPLLGICRGMQMLVKEAGSSLSKIDGHVATRHPLIQKDDTLPLPKQVNSYHNWGVHQCPENYSVLATANDGSIEAICHNNLPWEGWMWHPEREKLFTTYEINRAKNLLIQISNK